MTSVDDCTRSAHAAEAPLKVGSFRVEFEVNGAGGAGLGWKYGWGCIR